jgi:hypothetical protein
MEKKQEYIAVEKALNAYYDARDAACDIYDEAMVEPKRIYNNIVRKAKLTYKIAIADAEQVRIATIMAADAAFAKSKEEAIKADNRPSIRYAKDTHWAAVNAAKEVYEASKELADKAYWEVVSPARDTYDVADKAADVVYRAAFEPFLKDYNDAMDLAYHGIK